MTFLVHPEHGATNVSEAEVEQHKKHGWIVSTPEEWLAKKYKKEVDPVEEAQPKRRGRPARQEE